MIFDSIRAFFDGVAGDPENSRYAVEGGFFLVNHPKAELVLQERGLMLIGIANRPFWRIINEVGGETILYLNRQREDDLLCAFNQPGFEISYEKKSVEEKISISSSTVLSTVSLTSKISHANSGP